MKEEEVAAEGAKVASIASGSVVSPPFVRAMPGTGAVRNNVCNRPRRRFTRRDGNLHIVCLSSSRFTLHLGVV